MWMYIYIPSLDPRLLRHEERPGTHCMCFNAHAHHSPKSGESGYISKLSVTYLGIRSHWEKAIKFLAAHCIGAKPVATHLYSSHTVTKLAHTQTRENVVIEYLLRVSRRYTDWLCYTGNIWRMRTNTRTRPPSFLCLEAWDQARSWQAININHVTSLQKPSWATL